MTAEYARTEWDRALEAFRGAQLLLAHGGFDSAALRAYYAAFQRHDRPVRTRGSDIYQALGP